MQKHLRLLPLGVLIIGAVITGYTNAIERNMPNTVNPRAHVHAAKFADCQHLATTQGRLNDDKISAVLIGATIGALSGLLDEDLDDVASAITGAIVGAVVGGVSRSLETRAQHHEIAENCLQEYSHGAAV